MTGAWSRLPLRLTEIAAVLLALVIGYLVVDHYDITGGDMPPFVRSVGAGRVAHLTYADVRVTGVTTAAYLAPSDPSASVLAPAGVFLLVSVAFRPTREPTTLTSVWLEDGAGRRFQPSVRSGCANAPTGDTGVTTYAVLCFEVPPTLLDQFRLEATRDNLLLFQAIDDDDLADVDLGITAARATALAAPTATYRVVDTSRTPITLTPVTVTGAAS